MRKRGRLRPRSPAVGTIALAPRAAARPTTRLSSCGFSAPLGRIALGRSQGTEEGQSPRPSGPRDLHQQHHAYPSEAATLYEGFVGRTHRISVDAFCGDLLAVASLECLLDAHDQRTSFGHERLQHQPQQHATGLQTRPASTAKHSVVTMESLVLVQAHRAQGRADGSASRSEDGACHEYLNVFEDTLGEKWRER